MLGGVGILIGGGCFGDQIVIWLVLEGGFVKCFDFRVKDCCFGIDELVFLWYGLGEIVDVDGICCVYCGDDCQVIVGVGDCLYL